MAVKHTLYSNSIKEIAANNINWATEANLKVALLDEGNSTEAIWDQTHTQWGSVLSFETTSTVGYTAGGMSLPTTDNTINSNGRITEFKSACDPKWTSSTIDATHAVLYVAGSTGAEYLVSQIDFGSTESSVDGDFEITWTDQKVFTITVAEKA